jgi:hypothetical protein
MGRAKWACRGLVAALGVSLASLALALTMVPAAGALRRR